MIQKIFKPSVFKISLFLTLLCMCLIIIMEQRPNALSFLNDTSLKANVDTKFHLRGLQTVSEDVVIVNIDDSSIEKLGRWPWNRAILSKGLQIIAEGEPKIIALDMVFSEPDPNSYAPVLKSVQKKYQKIAPSNDKFSQTLSSWAYTVDTDRILSETIQKTNQTIPTVLGYFFYLSKDDIKDLEINWQERFQYIFNSRITAKISTIEKPPENILKGIGANTSYKIYADSTPHHGFFHSSADPDGIVRRAPLIGQYKNTLFPSFALKTAALALQREIIVQLGPLGIKNILLGKETLPTTPEGEYWINYAGPAKTFPFYSFINVYDESIPPSFFKDKIVLIGVSAKAVGDVKPTPVDNALPSVEINATIIENLIHKNYLSRPSSFFLLEILFIFCTGIFFGFLFQRCRALSSTIITFLLLMGYFLIDFKLLFKNGILANSFIPACHLFSVFISTTAYKYFVEEKTSRDIKTAFQHYVSPIVVNEILKDPAQLKLGGEKRKLTVLFSDIRGFTALCEQLSPAKLTQLLNFYLTQMTHIVFEHQGMLDKYIGDELMAIYGAPLKTKTHPLDACLSAIQMIHELTTVRKEWAKHDVQYLNIGIGIHTGDMIVGNMGSNRIFDYTVIGDSVNLGSRLQGINKIYGTQIIISKDVQKEVSTQIPCRELDSIRVRGKTNPIEIYEVLVKKPDNAMTNILKQFEKGLHLYRHRKWNEAAQIFESLKHEDNPSKALLERCHLYQKNPPSNDWNGIFTMTS